MTHTDAYHGKLFELRSSLDIQKRWLGTPIEAFMVRSPGSRLIGND